MEVARRFAEAEAAASECDMQQRAQLLLLPARMHT